MRRRIFQLAFVRAGARGKGLLEGRGVPRILGASAVWSHPGFLRMISGPTLALSRDAPSRSKNFAFSLPGAEVTG